jgi:DNA-directed RNA polymerase specialized sigma24 family protein
MNSPEIYQSLSAILTDWQNLHQAQANQATVARTARNQVAERYHGAIHRYLLSRLPAHPDVAAKLTSDLCMELLEGGKFLMQARPIPGKLFRNYLKTVLRNRVKDYFREMVRKGRLRQMPEGWENDLGGSPASWQDDDDEELKEGLSQELLRRALEAMAQDESTTGQACYALVRLRLQTPGEVVPVRQLASELSALLGKSFSENYVNVLACRARERFADFLVQEVKNALQTSQAISATVEQIENELIDLGLFLCGVKKALEKYQQIQETEKIGKPLSGPLHRRYSCLLG